MRTPPLPLFCRVAAITLVVTALEACAPHERFVAASVTPDACRSASAAPVVWPRSGEGRRTVRVALDVLDEASDGWRHEGRSRLDAALESWNAAGLPIRLMRDAGARHPDVQVVVMRRLPIDADDPNNAFRAGVTNLRHDAHGEIASAQVLIAEETPKGARYSTMDQEATLLHELGHALGLAHLDDPRALMSPRSSAVSLTPADLAMARSGYARPACVQSAVETASRPN